MRKKPKATSVDIAYRAGVSQATVSRVLRGSPLVNIETRKRVEAVARELNYKVDRHASSLRTQRAGCIGAAAVRGPDAGRVAHQPVLPVDARLDHARLREAWAGSCW
jgi:DNA-binding LacI/PurR family transcriptional regulator